MRGKRSSFCRMESPESIILISFWTTEPLRENKENSVSPWLEFRLFQKVFSQTLAQANDRQNRRPCQGFRKNAGITNIKALRLSLQVFINHCAHTDCSTRMRAAQRRGKDCVAPSTRFDQDTPANLF